MLEILRETARTLLRLGVTIALFTPLFLYLSHLTPEHGEFDFRLLTSLEQFLSVLLAILPFPAFAWLSRRCRFLRQSRSTESSRRTDEE